MTASIAIPVTVPRQTAATWTCDPEGNWHSATRLIWRDEKGWHDRPLLDEANQPQTEGNTSK